MKTNFKNIKHIIFDLGGVLLNIDYSKTVEAFRALGLENPLEAFTKEQQAELFQKFEKGKIDESTFIVTLQKEMPNANAQQLIDAWNAMLGDFPIDRFVFLAEISKKYDCYVLSNTNIIHQRAFEDIIDHKVGWKSFAELFTYVYYSHELGMRKPDAEIFEEVLRRHNLKGSETCFIDDSPQHVATAKKLGIHAVHLGEGEEIWDVLGE